MFSLFRFVEKIKSGFMSGCRARCPDNLIKGLIRHRVESFFHVIFAVADYFTFAIIEPFCPIVIVRALFKKEQNLAALIVKRFKIGFITAETVVSTTIRKRGGNWLPTRNKKKFPPGTLLPRDMIFHTCC